jgi:chaperonin cofactor prefoldin
VNKLEQLLKKFMGKIDQRFDKLEVDLQELRSDVTELKDGQSKMRADVRTDALNKRVYRLEVEVERISRQ